MKRLVILLIVFAFGCRSKATYEVKPDGVWVKFENLETKIVGIHPISEKIIRLTAAPTLNPRQTESLSVIPQTSFTDWTVEEENQALIVKTKAISAKLSLLTGEVVFTDITGKVLLQERTGGGKAYKEVSLDNENFYEVSMVFESPDDEAFYGLGQHQEGVMNYKGKDVTLFQYNTKVSVPFLVSNKNYGILWDNYSLSKFGDVRPYKQLSALKLFAKDNTPGGLTATYQSKNDSSHVYLTRQDSVINYQFLVDQKKFPKEFPLATGKVIWEGSLSTHQSGIHKFFIYYAGYLKVWVNNQLQADHWRQAWNPGQINFELDAEAGKKYPVRIEWLPDGSESYLSITWQQNQAEEQNRLSLFSEAADQIDYYFVAGNNLDEVISGYRTLTGKAEILPRWTFGFWQSRERYKTQKEILDVAAEFRKRKIPIDNIVLDWSYWDEDKWGSQEFDLSRFPDAEGMINELHEKYNLHFMISVWPKFYEGIESYNQFDKKGWLYKTNIKNRQRDWIGKGYVSTFYDAFNPEARENFWQLIHDKLYVKGVDAWWLDSTEPDILSNASIEERKQLMNPTALGSSTRYFNAYSLMNAKGVYEGLRQADREKRVFIFSRSAYAGSQRYGAATWSGDIAANWQDFKTQIPAGLNFSLSGIPYWTTDIGGFSVERKNERATGEDLENWRELNTRWFQFGVFNPLHRVHGQFPFREVYNLAPEEHIAYKTIVYYNKLRYRLFPYIYSLAGKTYFNDYTIMRALVMDFPTDKAVLNIGNEFMLGDALLVAPVTKYKARTWPVYLPQHKAGWFDFHTGKHYSGGQTIEAAAPLEQIPLFVKAGSIIPAGQQVQYVAEKPTDPLTLYVFTGADGCFDLYEDEGLNYNYQRGEFQKISFCYNEAERTLTIGDRKGNYNGGLDERKFEIVWIGNGREKGVTLAVTNPDRVVTYRGQTITIKN